MGLYNFIFSCGDKAYTSLFPNDVKNRHYVIFINMLHVLGVLCIQLGILLPPKFMKYYILYLVFLFMSYLLLNNRCFMTVLSNYIGGINYNSLCLKMVDAKYILYMYLVVGIIFHLKPEYSIYNLAVNVIFKNVN